MMQKIKQFAKTRDFKYILLLCLVLMFFSFGVVICYDSAHYLTYIPIFEGTEPFSSWKVVRGVVFPLVIFLSNVIFGKNVLGLLISMFLFYLVFTCLCYYFVRKITFMRNHAKIICPVILIFLILNPVVFGYFHTLLTEYIAMTLVMINIFLAYKWSTSPCVTWKSKILYVLAFSFSAIFCYHLKQPYFTIIFIPLILSIIVSIAKNHHWRNVLYRFAGLGFSVVMLFLSIFVWNQILSAGGVHTDASSSTSSNMAASQLLEGAGIHDENPTSIGESLGIYFSHLVTNPFDMFGTYFKHFCGLTSVCTIESEDGVYYRPTLNLNFTSLYENSIIPSRIYSSSSAIFYMTDELYSYASAYAVNPGHRLLDYPMKLLEYPTTYIYKLVMFINPVLFVVSIVLLIITRKKHQKISDVSILAFLFLGTASLHMILSGMMGLMIDRYAVAVFVPATLGVVCFIYQTIDFKKR